MENLFATNYLPTFKLLPHLIGFGSTILLSAIIALIYSRHGLSIDNKKQFSLQLTIFAISIFIIITTIKFSLALSLGLVGALSIIRFRTAVKDTEQTIVLLAVMGIALQNAAEYYIASIISTTILSFILIIYSKIGQNIISHNFNGKNKTIFIKISSNEGNIFNDFFSTFSETITSYHFSNDTHSFELKCVDEQIDITIEKINKEFKADEIRIY